MSTGRNSNYSWFWIHQISWTKSEKASRNIFDESCFLKFPKLETRKCWKRLVPNNPGNPSCKFLKILKTGSISSQKTWNWHFGNSQNQILRFTVVLFKMASRILQANRIHTMLLRIDIGSAIFQVLQFLDARIFFLPIVFACLAHFYWKYLK